MGVCCSDRHRSQKLELDLVACTCFFKQPVAPLGSSSSGVRFFQLIPVCLTKDPSACETGDNESFLRGEKPGTQSQWLGKDYAQAFDEAEFYNACYQLRRQDGAACWRLFDFLPSFHGIVRHVGCAVPGMDPQRLRVVDLLVFRSPLEGLARPRVLNVEVGTRTSALQYRRGSEMGTVMFARREGVRIEGFMAPPSSVPNEEPGVDTKGWTWGDTTQRRAKRQALQSLRLREVLAALVDLRDAILEERFWPCASVGEDEARAFIEQFLGPAEYSELALLHVVKELASLLRASTEVPVAQKWFGGSVAFLVEAGVAPPRTGPIRPEDWVAARVKLRLFGWSRSRITDPEEAMMPDEQTDNELLWQIYKDSLGCILWEAAHLYFHCFCVEAWTTLTLEVRESSAKGEALLGVVELALDDTPPQQTRTLPLLCPESGAAAQSHHGVESTLTIKTGLFSYDFPSRLAGAWHIQVVSASNLPPSRMKMSPSMPARPDVYVVVTLREQGSSGGRSSSQRTRMDSNRPFPVWREDFEFAVASPGADATHHLHTALGFPARMECTLDEHLIRPMPPNSTADDEAARRQMAFLATVHEGWQEPNEELSVSTKPADQLSASGPVECSAHSNT